MTDTNRRARRTAAKPTAPAADAVPEDVADATADDTAPAADRTVDAQAQIDNDEVDPLTSADYTVAFSPRQVAVGLAIVAGLVALVAARRRRRGPGQEG